MGCRIRDLLKYRAPWYEICLPIQDLCTETLEIALDGCRRFGGTAAVAQEDVAPRIQRILPILKWDAKGSVGSQSLCNFHYFRQLTLRPTSESFNTHDINPGGRVVTGG